MSAAVSCRLRPAFALACWASAAFAASGQGLGLLIPRCSSVHTFGMRFALDLVFLDRAGRPLSIHRAVPPRRLVWHRGAAAVLEIPAPQGGEIAAAKA